MSLFTWKPEYSVGAPVIDAQHQKLFRMADDLHRAMSAGKGKDHLSELLDALIAYTCEHFATEETMMRKTSFPGFTDHYKEHEDLKRQVVEFRQKMAANNAVLTIDVMEFLSSWLSHHIKGSDQKLASFISAPVH